MYGISVQKSLVSAKTVCKYLYGHGFYLTKEEALQNDPSLSSFRNDEEDATEVTATGEERDEERLEENDQKFHEKTTTITNQASVDKRTLCPINVLPSPKALTDYQQYMTIQAESNAANALYNICHLHYDTISRCKIDGEWLAIISNFSRKEWDSRRPLFFWHMRSGNKFSVFLWKLLRDWRC